MTDTALNAFDTFDPSVVETVKSFLTQIYPECVLSVDNMRDLRLATSEGRASMPKIGTECADIRNVGYLIENIYWINVCLFVNADFRSCFNDAILIERAMGQVGIEDYAEFRDDMNLSDGQGSNTPVEVEMSRYNDGYVNLITNFINRGRQGFDGARMGDAYNELVGRLSTSEYADTRNDVAIIVEFIIYLVNAVTYNGVFMKYLKLVIENVKKQLSGV